jgi:arylsulfatase A-like enzyme
MIRFLPLLVLGFSLAQAQQPNILFLLSDDQRADALSASGNTHIRTPSIDALALRGVRFTRAYYMGSPHAAVCAPSRAMLLSGRSLYHVNETLEGIPTLPLLLREAGYVTFGTGKWHNGKTSFASAFSRGKDVFFGGMSDHTRVPVCDLRSDGTYSATTRKGFSSTVFADAAVDFLTAYASGDQASPFFAYVAFTAPHDPRTPPEGYANMYRPENLPLPPDYMPVHPFDNGWMTGRDEQLAPWPRTPEVIRSQMAEYYGLISHLDREIGRILQCVEDAGLRERTIIVFASDNGLSLGSHGLMGKQNLYEHSTRVPLILCGPGVPAGQRSDALVYLYDLTPSLLEMTGIAAPPQIDGHSLLSVLRADSRTVRSSIFTCYGVYQRGVRDDRWKLIRYPHLHYTQLFDLEKDPWELENLADVPAYRETQERMMDLLLAWQRESGDTLSLTSCIRSPMSFDPGSVHRSPDPHQPEEIIKKYFSPQR